MKPNWLLTVILVVVIGAAAFFGGIQYQKMQRSTVGQFSGAGFRQRFGQNGNVRPVRGQVVSVDSTGITVKMQDGSSKIILLSGSTMIFKSDSASESDIKSGDTVMVFGTQNADGSVTAQNVQLNPPAGVGIVRQVTPTGSK